MRTKRRVLTALFVTTALTACSQDPAPVVDHSRADYSQERSVAMAPAKARPISRQDERSNAPIALNAEVDNTTQHSADVQTVASRDLAPIGAPEPAAARNSVSSTGAGPAIAGPVEGPQAEPFQTAGDSHLEQSGSMQGTVIYRSKHHSSAAQKALDKALTTPRLTQQAEVKKEVKKPLVASKSFIWPLQGKVVSRFGPKKAGVVNEGINIAADSGEPVKAAANGVVAYAGDKIHGYGNMVLVKHPGGKTTTYAHLDEIKVKKGQQIDQGDTVGTVGSTGNVPSPQLHFAIRQGVKAVNPESLIPRNLASAAY